MTGRRWPHEPLGAVSLVVTGLGLMAVLVAGYGFTRPQQDMTVQRATTKVSHGHRGAVMMWSSAVRHPGAASTDRLRLLSPC